jgi:hypothetical protein
MLAVIATLAGDRGDAVVGDGVKRFPFADYPKV